MRVAFALPLVLALLLASPGTQAAEEPRIMASAYRVDLGLLEPGAAVGGELMLSNPGYEGVTVRLIHEGEPVLLETPSEVIVPPSASVAMRYLAHVPVDASPGFHGEALRLAPRAISAHTGAGTMDAGTAVVFTWRIAAVGVSAIEAPSLVLAGENITGAVVVVNTWTAPANVTVRLRWLDASGAAVGSAMLGPVSLDPNGTARLSYDLPGAQASAGLQTLEAQVESHAPVGGKLVQAFPLGLRSASMKLLSVDDTLDGNATVDVDVENTGTVPITVRPRVRFDGPGGVREVELDAVTLRPGEKRTLRAYAALPPGAFSASLEDATGLAMSVLDGAPEPIFQMSSPELERNHLTWLPWAVALALVLGVLLPIGGAWWFLSRKQDGPKPEPAPAEPFPWETNAPAPVPAPIAAPTPRAVPVHSGSSEVAVLLDLRTLGFVVDPHALVAACARGREVVLAQAYDVAPTRNLADESARRIESVGIATRVRAIDDEPADWRVEICLEAVRQTRTGRVVVLATHDPAFVPLAAELADQGARLEVVGVGSRIPPGLRAEAAVHDLVPRERLMPRERKPLA